jgi:hypothetical protein
MRVLVTGATGLLGERVVARLIAEDHHVAILTRRPFRAEQLFGRRVVVGEWHPGCDPLPKGALDGIDAVVHLAGEPLGGAASPERLTRIRTSRIAAAGRLAASRRGGRLHVVAASVVVPPPGALDALTEASPRPAPATHFERDMLASEAACRALAGDGTTVTVVRLGLLLGPGPVLQALAGLAAMGSVPALSGALVPAIDPEDAAALLAGLAARPEISGPIFGVAPEPLPGTDLAQSLTALRRWPVRLPVPDRLARRRIGPLAALLYNRARIVPQRLIEAGAGFLHPDPRQSLVRALAMTAGMAASAGTGEPRIASELAPS